MEDNQYRASSILPILGLQDVFATTKEIYAANIFNTGTVFDPTVGGDRQGALRDRSSHRHGRGRQPAGSRHRLSTRARSSPR